MSAPTREPDCALLALIGEYQRREARVSEFGVDDAERDRRCDEAREIREQIGKTRPVTLRGVLAVARFSFRDRRSALLAPEAIEGLRAIVKREGQL